MGPTELELRVNFARNLRRQKALQQFISAPRFASNGRPSSLNNSPFTQEALAELDVSADVSKIGFIPRN